jgi:hypothetical protein
VNAASADPAAEKAGPVAVAPALAGADRPADPEATQRAAEISGPIAVRLSGLPLVEHDEFRARASVAAAAVGSSSGPVGPAGQRPTSPITPGSGGPIAGVDAGAPNSGGAGSSGSNGGNSIPPAVLLDPDSAPLVFALSELMTPERRITWWYPEVVVGPG